MISKVVISIVALITAYLISIMWSDKNDHLINKSANKPNFVLFTVDTLRADHLSTYGYDRKTSPNLDLIVKDSIIFDNAYSVATYSAPAHASLLTGLYPAQFGINNNELKIPQTINTLAEILQNKGYTTAAFIGDMVLGRNGNFDQGFDTFSVDEIHADTTSSVTKKWAERGWIKAENWLQQIIDKNNSLAKYQQQPFFLWFHANHPHGNYSPPPNYRHLYVKQAPSDIKSLQTDPNFSLDSYFRKQIEKGNISQDLMNWVIAQYDGEIAFSDYIFGQLINFLKSTGEYDNTIIIFMADHGEVLFEHWRAGKIRSAGHHANLYYQSVLNVPLLIKPDKASVISEGFVNKRNNSLISSIDVFNTSLDLLTIKDNHSSSSHSLIASLKNKEKPHRTEVFFSGQAYDNICSGIIQPSWQLVKCKMQDEVKKVIFNLTKEPENALKIAQLQKQQFNKISLLEKELDHWYSNLALIVEQKVKEQNISQQTPVQQNNSNASEKMQQHLERSGYLDKRKNL